MTSYLEAIAILEEEKSHRQQLEELSTSAKERQDAFKLKAEVMGTQYARSKRYADDLYDSFYKPGEDGKVYVDTILASRREIKSKLKATADGCALRDLKEALRRYDEEFRIAQALITYGLEVRIPELSKIAEAKQQEAKDAAAAAKEEIIRIKKYSKKIDPYPY